MRNYRDLCDQVDALVKSGNLPAAAELLTQIRTTKVSREWRLPLAIACRRAGAYAMGIALLSKHVMTDKTPAPAESAEYAALLLRAGAADDCVRVLENMDVWSVPNAPLYKAFAYFSRWEFENALGCLEGYLQRPLTDYARLVGQVNLSFALIELERYDVAEQDLERLLLECGKNRHTRLESNCHALRAQIHLHRRDFRRMDEDLKIAKRLLSKADSHDQFFITRWAHIGQALESKSLAPLEELKAIAMRDSEWEGLREADFYALQIQFEQERFLHLLFGTPKPGFRARVCKTLGNAPDRECYVWGAKSAPRLDLNEGTIHGKPADAPGRKCLQIVEILSRDFYQPLRIPGLFFTLFPGEYYDWETSPDRVHQILRRTRRWLEEESIPLQIKERDGFFSLTLGAGLSIRLPLERHAFDTMNLQWADIEREFRGDAEFSSQTVRTRLGFSKSSTQRILSWGVDNGKLHKSGPKNRTVYSVTQSSARHKKTG